MFATSLSKLFFDMHQESIPISGLWFRSNANGTRIDVLIEIDKEWKEVASFSGNGQGITSHIVEPLGIRVAIQCEQPMEIN
jgi:hypothetical protein